MNGIIRVFKSLLRRVLGRHLTEEEIHFVIQEGEQKGVIDREEHDMIDAVLDLGETRVREIQVPRTEIFALDKDTPFAQVMAAVVEQGHSRIPVFEADIDHIIGILYAKDLLRYWGKEVTGKDFLALPRKPFFVPESKTLGDLLRELKARRTHMAITVDEYGGTSGLVTIEDILEEIVGEIQDEYDLEENQYPFRRLTDSVWLFDARAHIEELEDEAGLSLPRGDFDTVGGFLSHLLGRVPARGARAEFGPLEFTVEEADERRALRIRVERKAPGESE